MKGASERTWLVPLRAIQLYVFTTNEKQIVLNTLKVFWDTNGHLWWLTGIGVFGGYIIRNNLNCVS